MDKNSNISFENKMINMKKKVNIKTIIFIILLIVLVLIDFMMYSKFIYNDRSDYIDDFLAYDYALKDENIKETDGKIEIVQTITATGNNFEAISIGFNKSFRTYNNKPIHIKIVEKDSQNIIAEYDNIYDSISKDYKEHKFTFKKQADSFGKKYDIIINYEQGLDDNAVLYSEKICDSGNLTINGEEQTGHISFKLHYDSKYANAIFWVAFIGINLLAIIDFYIILFKKYSINKIFLVTVSVLGLIYMVIVPMYRGHDEHAHFFRAYEIARGVFNTEIRDGYSVTEIPAVFRQVMRDANDPTDKRDINEGYYKDVIQSADAVITNDTILEDGSYMAVYSFVPYIPQTLAIKIVSLFTNRVVVLFYAARLANLIVAVLMLYIAFKIIPYGKNLLFLICIIPTTLCQISSMSPDAMTITSCILFIAYVLKLINDNKEITKKNIVILTIIGLMVSLSKITYIPIVFTALLIPKKLYKNSKSKIKSMLIVILIPIIINLIWLGFAGVHLAYIDNNKAAVQKSFILSNPIEYIRVCAYTVYYQFGAYMNGLFGQNLEHISYVRVGEINVYIFIITLTLIVLFDDSMKNKISNFGKIVIGSMLVIIIALIFTSLYMQWAGYKWYFVEGIQGRYFIELLLPFGLLLAQNNIVKKANIDLKTIILCVTCITNIIAIMSCVIAYI